MRKHLNRYLLCCLPLFPCGIHAQDMIVNELANPYNSTAETLSSSQSLMDEWDGMMYTLNYFATTKNADKGGIGAGMQFFNPVGKNVGVGMSIGWMNLYSLATEKWADDGFGGYFGLNVSFLINKNLILYAPVCATYSGYSDGSSDKKTAWGASVIPSLGLKAGKLFISAGWNLAYSFKTEKTDTECFFINLGLFIKD